MGVAFRCLCTFFKEEFYVVLREWFRIIHFVNCLILVYGQPLQITLR